MPELEAVNLPDLLGAITGGERLNLDVVQCALAVRPSATPAGRPFLAVLLLQNASDIDVDVTARVRLPERDAANQRNRFFAQRERLLVGLRPAEVGYLALPLSSSPNAKPGQGYRLVVELEVKRMDRQKPRRVRQPEGGGLFVETELTQEAQDRIWGLQQLIFSAERAGRSGVAVPFTVKPPEVGKVPELAAEWVSLWTLSDHVDERVLLERVREPLERALPQLRREVVFYPLLEAVQTRFKAGGYALKAGEAVYISKLLTLVVENGAAMAGEGESGEAPAWLLRCCRVLLDRPEAANNVPYLTSQMIFHDVVRDAVRLGLTMVETVTGEHFGDAAEQEDYAEAVVRRLQEGGLDFAHTYLPLVLGGLIANARVVMPKEQPRQTIYLLQKAREERASEADADNGPIFAMTDQLIERALDQMAGYAH